MNPKSKTHCESELLKARHDVVDVRLQPQFKIHEL